MGLEETIRSRTTEEAGLKFVDENDHDIAVFPVDKETGMSFSSDIGILLANFVEYSMKNPKSQ